ncbi:hypothetical protein F3N42_00755 [Marinihelvus fidelis]|uniref:Uncharacterized protein n=1 Tax=Marinihelvus fidelis TaxID=2613842 RepID=A0A5N0THN9_9GAMM|nr:hypothetical protein [Marinihelvus fidelis]KAA9134111.1 hypothetical protein F3N42_00755 [Marinihelvus fidelis]
MHAQGPRIVSICASLMLAAACSSSTADPAPASDHAVTIDESQPFPSIMYSDILKSMSDQVFWEKGQLRFFERVRMTFLPDFQDPQHIAPYNKDTGAFLVSQLANKGGEVVSTVYWEARKDSFPYWTASAVNNSDPAPLAEGGYTLTWSIDGAPFWSLPFVVEGAAAASAYDQPNLYLEGPWNDWAYIYVPNGNLSQAPTFNLFIRDRDASPGLWTDLHVTVGVERDGELIGQYNMEPGAATHATIQAKPWWVAQELALRRADGSGFLPASEIVAPGKYEVTVTIDGEEYASYRYTADGAIPFTGRQDRESADPMNYLEGAQDRFYLERR